MFSVPSDAFYGLFTQCDCDCDFLSQQIGSIGYHCNYSHGVIAIMTLNPMQPISCDKYIADAIAPYERPFKVTRVVQCHII